MAGSVIQKTLGGYINRAPDARISEEPAFVLRMRPWSETSLLVDFYTKSQGRVLLRAKGAKRPTSPWRGILSEFAPLLISYRGGGSTKTLTQVKWMGGFAPVDGQTLLSGFYLNELLMRFTEREDPNEELFAAYWEALRVLSGQREDISEETALRIFELRLLRFSGYGLPEKFDDGLYFLNGAELLRVQGSIPAGAQVCRAETLRDIVSFRFSDPETAKTAKVLLRNIISAVLGDRPLNSRRILAELRNL